MGEWAKGGEVPWAGLFCGRAAELTKLSAAFERVERGGGPEVAVVLGESGLGKTRLVQEFFARLNAQPDGASETGYWPPRLVRGGNNLAINPDPADCNPSALSQMNFLWWGIRMLDRQGHNAGLGGISDSIQFLRAHLEPFAKAKLLGARMKQAATGAAVDVAVEVANLFTFGLIGLGKLGVDHAREWKGILTEHKASEAASPAAQEQQQRESLIEVTLRDLGILFESSEKKGARLPAIVLLDDAQWLGDDENSLLFVKQLLQRAKAESWPLLLIATHWQKEWHEDLSDPAKASLARLLSDWSQSHRTEITLGKEPDLGLMIETGFPGLTGEQVRLLLEKAGGNPRLLDEMLRYMQRKKAFFEGRDTGQPLTERGMAQLSEATFALHDLVADRLAAAPETVQRAVGLASLQGERFLESFVAMTAESLAEEEPDEGLARAERPHSFIFRLAEDHSEFAQRVFMDVAREQLDDILDSDAAEKALRETLVVLAGDGAQFKRLDVGNRELARQVTIYVLSAFDGDLVERERHCLADCYYESTFKAFDENDALRAHEHMRKAIGAIRAETLAVTDFSTSALRLFSSLLITSGDSEARIMINDVMIRRLENTADGSARHFAALADVYGYRAKVLGDFEGPDIALQWSQRAVQHARKADELSGSSQSKLDLYHHLHDHLIIEEAIKGLGGGRAIQEECGSILRELKEAEPSLPHLAYYASHLGGLAMTELGLGRAEEALPFAEDAVEAAAEYLAASQTVLAEIPKAKSTYANQKRWLGAVFHSLGRHEESVAELETAITMLEQVWEEYQQLHIQDSLIDALTTLGIYYNHAGRTIEEATAPVERALQLARNVDSIMGGRSSSDRVAGIEMIVGRAYALDGRLDEGLALMREGETRFLQDIAATGSLESLGQLLRVRAWIAEFLAKSGEDAEALEVLVTTRESYSDQIRDDDRMLRKRMDEITEMIEKLQQ